MEVVSDYGKGSEVSDSFGFTDVLGSALYLDEGGKWSNTLLGVASALPPMNRAGKSRLEVDLSRPPSLVEPWLQRAVEAQDDVPSLAGDSCSALWPDHSRGGCKQRVLESSRIIGTHCQSLGSSLHGSSEAEHDKSRSLPKNCPWAPLGITPWSAQ